MATRPDPDDDDFSELYKEYTGPARSNATNAQDRVKSVKKSDSGSDEEEKYRDPNAVPTDFTSREAKVWEAKSKATERNWKKRKEEEMICKICGESGHFTQGCPSTLGANRKSQDFFERVAAREKHVKELFTEKVLQKIEKEIGCKIKMEEKFIIVSGKDRLILAKGVDVVHKVIKGEDDQKGSSSHMTRSRSPVRNRSPVGVRSRSPIRVRSRSPIRVRSRSPIRVRSRSPVGARMRRSESQKSHASQQNASRFHQQIGRQEKVVEDRVREDLRKFSKGSPQAYGNGGARSRTSHSKSPAGPPYTGNSYNSHDGNNQNIDMYKTDGWDTAKRGSDMQSGRQFDYPAPPQTVEELELEYRREATDLGRIRDREEDQENYKHREAIRELRENYMKKLAVVRGMHAKQWEEFLQHDAQKRQQQAWHQISAPNFGGYKQKTYSDQNDGSSANPHYVGDGLPIDSRRFPNPMGNYPPMPRDSYSEFQLQRHGDFGKTYNRF